MKGHPGHSVLINQFGSERRMAMALGVDRVEEIAERITGAHWSGPRFFGLTPRAGASVGAEAGR